MTSTIERDFVVKNGVASFPMKEYPNYCGIEDIGYISHGEWADAELEYKEKEVEKVSTWTKSSKEGDEYVSEDKRMHIWNIGKS